ncbi:MAG: hypothetical protein JSU04_01610 [Bdellovibrionales bacterium]|nr:hypothetical protein [Bdellovibrionales bacterium]
MKLFVASLLSGLFFSTTLFANPSRPVCSMQLLCDQMRNTNTVLNFDIPENTNSEKSLESLEPLFAENQAAILELLAQRKSSLSQSTFDSLVKAISTVTLGNFEDPKIRKVFPGACNRPNAIYIAGMHKVYVCPSLLSYPQGTLKQILAHELGHVIQKLQNHIPCFKDFPKKQVDEIFADWVASKVLSEKIALERDKRAAGKQAFESQLLFLSLACGQPQKKPDWAQTHPNFQNRIEQIFLSQPAFQEALRCHSKSMNSCG